MEYLDRYNGACHVRQDKRDIGSKVIRRSGVFPANVKRVCYYRRVNNKSWINFLLYKKVILLSRQVLFSRNYLIIYSSSSLLLSSILDFSSKFFLLLLLLFVRGGIIKKEKKEWRGMAREWVEYFQVSHLLPAFENTLDFEALTFSRYSRDLTFQKGAMNSLASILLRRAVLRHWDEQNENSRRTWKLQGRPRFLSPLFFPRFLAQKSGPLSVSLRYLSTNVRNFSVFDAQNERKN